ncbi:MAG: hypothetical protein E7564_03840 [Ruminococcaceae bacterium]|nr:hypothetical protein [Oscillospiraceae bacterium]
MRYKTEINEILFRYADSVLLKNEEGEKEIRGFLYRKTTHQESYLWASGVRDKDCEFTLVADEPNIRTGDLIKYKEREFVISEVSPLCIREIDAGVTAKAVLIKT